MGRKKTDIGMSRREFMKLGAAASFALPFLKSSIAMGQSTAAPVRVLVIPLLHGWGFDYNAEVRVTGTETNWSFPRPLTPLNAVRDQCVIVDPLRTSYWGNAHDVSYSDILSCAVSPDAPTSSMLGGPFFVPRTSSLDSMIGQHHSKGVLRFSHNYTSWGARYHPLSFDSSLRNLPFYTTAREAYMGVIDPLKQMPQNPANPDAIANDALMRFLGDGSQRLLSRLSGEPRARMESYIVGMNSLGNRILGSTSGGGAPSVTLPDLPGMNLNYNDQLDHYFEMIRVAFTLDTHRVAILGLSEGITSWPWTNSQGQVRNGNTFGNDFHHDIAHYSAGDTMAAMHGWTNWYAQKVANFVNTLKNTTDVDGRPMIDNTIIVLTGEVCNGQHDRSSFTHVVIGGGGAGRIRRNRWLQLPTFNSRNATDRALWTSRNMNGSLHQCDINYVSRVGRHHAADLWVSIARLAGLNIDRFGFDVYNYQPIQLT